MAGWRWATAWTIAAMGPAGLGPSAMAAPVPVALVSDATVPLAARRRMRAFDMAGRPLGQHEAAATLPPLSAMEAATLPNADLFTGAAPAPSHAVAQLLIDGREASRAIVGRVLTKDMAYPDPGLKAAWQGDRLTVTPRALARAASLDFSTAAAAPSDDGFDVLPGESRTNTVSPVAPRRLLARALTLRSLGTDQ